MKRTDSTRSEVLPMNEESLAELEMTIVLPLGVIAQQLLKVEAQLRLLNITGVGVRQGA